MAIAKIGPMNGLKNAIRLLPIRPYTQKTNYECGLACVQTILSSKGISVDRLRLKKALGTSKNVGTIPKKIKKVVRGLGIKAKERFEQNILDIEKEIRRGKLCLVAYQAWGDKKYFETLQSGHYSVVFGYEKDYLWLMDPNVRGGRVKYKKGIRKISKKVFLARWKDEDAEQKLYNRWYLAI